MTAWLELPRKEEDRVWDRFYSHFKFRPSTRSEDWPGIAEPTPSVTYSLDGAFRGSRDRRDCLRKGSELNMAMLDAFRQCTTADEELYVLDWQHPCYRFRPHADFSAGEWSGWKTPVLPDGDYSIFLQRQLDFGTFWHPWEETLCVFGSPLIRAFDPNSVPWLESPVRKNGGAA